MESILDIKMLFKKEKKFLKNMIACGLKISMKIKMIYAHMNLNRPLEFQLIYMLYVLDLILFLKTLMQAIFLKESLLDNH